MTVEPSAPAGPRVTLGRITGPFGVKGWVKVRSYTEPAEEVLDFGEWHVDVPRGGPRTLRPLEGRRHGKAVVARLEGIGDRDAAAALAHCDVSVPRSQLPALEGGQYYWADLEGLEVVTTDGTVLGRLQGFAETPANPVMIVVGERERLVPLVPQHLKEVDLDAGRVVVDWDPDV